MAWQSSWQSAAAIDRSDLERLLHEFEARLARLTRGAVRRREPRAIESVIEMAAGALSDLAERVRGGARHMDVGQISDDALQLGNKALRKLTREVEHRPLVTLAIAVGIGALAFALLARRD